MLSIFVKYAGYPLARNPATASPRRIGSAAILISLCLCFLTTSHVRAQDFAGSGATVHLLSMKLIGQTTAESTVRLYFAPHPNSLETISGKGTSLSVRFPKTTLAQGVFPPSGLNGILHTMSFDQTADGLTVNFAMASTAQIQSSMVDGSTIDLKFLAGSAQPGPIDETPANPVSDENTIGLGARDFELVRLQYADVSEVVGMLTGGSSIKSNDTFAPHEPGFGSSSMTGGNLSSPASADIPSNDQSEGQFIDANIAVDRRLNAVLLRGSSEQIARMKREIALFDQPVDTVMLETQLVELTKSGAKALGIDLASSDGAIATGTLQTGQLVSPYGGLNPTSWVKTVSLQAAIYDQIQHGDAKIISRPRIAAQSGSTAKIVTGNALPILTAIALSGVNGVSQQVQYVNVGVTLQIAPRVTDDGYVTSHVFCVVSSVSGSAQGYPTISQREAETSATVKDGEPFVIGGLTQETAINQNNKTPGIGDVPLLGGLFNTKRESRETTELYIIVTPHIIHRHT